MPSSIKKTPTLTSSTNRVSTIATAGAVVDWRDSWRIFRMMAEFVDGYEFLSGLQKEVTIFGSARLPANNKYFKVAVELGRLLAKAGMTTITGGGPGIMEAANRGAFEAGGESVGLNIQLPHEQRTNPFVKKSVAFYYFFTRKVMMTSPANAFVFFPGGFGTLDEFFEVVDAMELGQMPKSPVVLVGREFWSPLIKFLRAKSAQAANALAESEIDQWHVVESAEEAMEFIKDAGERPAECSIGDPNCRGGVDWRVFRIMAEMVDGFEFVSQIGQNVTVLGTKNITAESKYYQDAHALGKILAQNKYAVMTGGGPGIMEAANRGAFEVGGVSVGIDMLTQAGERRNDYLTKSIRFNFPFVRKLIITSPSKAFVFFPGGLATLHQLFELLTLVETKKVEPIPLVLYDREFWQPLLDYIHTLYEDFKTINQTDQQLISVLDSPEDVMNYL